tara:strand:+ start:429 stop:608 length:180 start_codon:yes stop_codon:yes gene_type:complete
MESLKVGDDVFNSTLNQMGSFRNRIDDNTVRVRTASGLRDWAVDDCHKVLNPDYGVDVY